MDVMAWAELIYIDPKIKIRDSSSSHQEQIQTIWDFIETAKSDPSDKLTEEILSLNPIKCRGNSTHVVYCRYLQHCIEILRNEGKMEK